MKISTKIISFICGASTIVSGYSMIKTGKMLNITIGDTNIMFHGDSKNNNEVRDFLADKLTNVIPGDKIWSEGKNTIRINISNLPWDIFNKTIKIINDFNFKDPYFHQGCITLNANEVKKYILNNNN